MKASEHVDVKREIFQAATRFLISNGSGGGMPWVADGFLMEIQSASHNGVEGETVADVCVNLACTMYQMVSKKVDNAESIAALDDVKDAYKKLLGIANGANILEALGKLSEAKNRLEMVSESVQGKA